MGIYIMKITAVGNVNEARTLHDVFHFDQSGNVDSYKLNLDLQITGEALDETLELVECWIGNCYAGDILEFDNILLICLGTKYKKQSIVTETKVEYKIKTVENTKASLPTKPKPKNKETPIHNPVTDTFDEQEED